VLSGEGSDELFAGYPKYQYAKLVESLRLVPYNVRSRLFSAIEKTMPASMNRQRTLVRVAAQKSEVETFKSWFAPFTEIERRDIFDHSGHKVLENIQQDPNSDVINRMAYQDFYGWLPDNILERTDRTSMMNSLELRPPFLDVNVFEFSRTIPSKYLVNLRDSKIVLRNVARRYLPEQIFNRNKHGFKVPLDDWFRNHLRDFAYDHLTSADSLSMEMFDTKFVRNLLDDHVNGKHNDGMRIYTLVALELWYRNRALTQ
jgi:asparagine synthase (glutamine-hydrolysing)